MIYLSGITRWKGTRDEEHCFLKNVAFMREVINSQVCQKLSEPTKIKINDDLFLDNVKTEVEKLNPICTFIDKVQSRECSLAEGIHCWLKLKKIKGKENSWIKRNMMVCSFPALIAYSLHPQLKGELLSPQQKNLVSTKMFNNGTNAELYDSYEDFVNCKGLYDNESFFKLNPELFWDLMSATSEELSIFALKYVSLPSSTASLERVFSQWAYVHDKSRNRLSADRSAKLLFCYHHLRTNEK